MNVKLDKNKEKEIPKHDTNTNAAGSFIKDANGNRIPNLKDKAMKHRKKLADDAVKKEEAVDKK